MSVENLIRNDIEHHPQSPEVTANCIAIFDHSHEKNSFPKVADLRRHFETATLSGIRRPEPESSIGAATCTAMQRHRLSPIPGNVRVIDLLPRFSSAGDNRRPWQASGERIVATVVDQASARASSASPPRRELQQTGGELYMRGEYIPDIVWPPARFALKERPGSRKTAERASPSTNTDHSDRHTPANLRWQPIRAIILPRK